MGGIGGAAYDNDLSYAVRRESKCKLFAKVPTRLVLYLLSIWGFIISNIMRCDINITILAMVKEPKHYQIKVIEEQNCYTDGQTNNTSTVVDYGGTLDWSPDVQNYILNCYYWVYTFSSLLGGAVIQKVGPKRALIYGQLGTAIASLCIPWASENHYGLVITLRCIQGFTNGSMWPAIYYFIGYWIPVQERSRFMSCFQGYNIGIGLSYVICGFIIVNFGWKYVFYTTGSLGLIWCTLCYLLVFDSPESHPRISPSEMEYIRENTDTTYAATKQHAIPWMSILRSPQVWAIGIVSFGRIWIIFTFTIYGPQYMKSTLGFNVEKNGVLSGLPFILSYLCILVCGYVADKLIALNVLSMTNTRKLFTAIGQVIPGLLCILLGYLGCNIAAIMTAWFLSVILLSASFAGAMASIVDIAPNYAGPILGFVQLILMSGSILGPLFASHITKDGHTLSAWRVIFNVSSGIALITCLIYQIWGTSEILPWNEMGSTASKKEAERMLQNTDGKDKKGKKLSLSCR